MSETKRFDVPEVLAALEAAVAKRGEDYVYVKPEGQNVCLYVHDRDTDNPTPGCIVGQVYFDLTGELISAVFEGDRASDVLPSRTFTFAALDVLDVAQVKQDGGVTWGEALAAARKAVENG